MFIYIYLNLRGLDISFNRTIYYHLSSFLFDLNNANKRICAYIVFVDLNTNDSTYISSDSSDIECSGFVLLNSH